MKKFLAFALCALMVLSLSAVVFAADENLFEYNFEDDAEGDFIAIDNSIKFYPKQGTVEIVKFDGTMCAKLNQVGFEDKSGNMDCYVDFVAGGVSSYGLEQQYVLEYDVYFEKMGPSNNWQILCSREAAPAGTQFQQVGHFRGTEDGKTINITATGVDEPLGTVQTGKWYTVAACIDKKNSCFSFYIDGVCYAKDYDYDVVDPSASESERARSGFGSCVAGDDAIAYLDNVKAYNGTKPRNVKSDTPVTPAVTAPVTEAPADTTAVVTAVTTAPATKPDSSVQTADIAVVIAAVAAVAASGAIIVKKKH